MRVLLALGGNAMTNADGRARPEDQIAAAAVAMEAVADLLQHDVDVVDHPRQRPPGRQPAGQERARRRRRPAGAARLVRRPDPGDARLRADGRARRRPRRDAASTGVRRPWSPAPSWPPTTPASPRRPSRSAASCPPPRPRCSSSTARPGRTAARRAGAASSPRPSRCEIIDAPAVQALVDAGFVVVANGGGGIPVVRDADGTLQRRRGRDRQGPRRRPAGPHGRRRRARHRDRRPPRRAPLRHARGARTSAR